MPEQPTRAVRRASDEDAAPLAQLINRANQVERAFLDADRTSPDEVRRLQQSGQFLVLDRDDGGLAATVYLEIQGRRGHFSLLSVDPELQGVGVGRRMVAVAELLCQAEGCDALELEVVNLREELPPFYRSLGYQPCGTAPFEDAALEQPAHFIRMAKPLQQ